MSNRPEDEKGDIAHAALHLGDIAGALNFCLENREAMLVHFAAAALSGACAVYGAGDARAYNRRDYSPDPHHTQQLAEASWRRALAMLAWARDNHRTLLDAAYPKAHTRRRRRRPTLAVVRSKPSGTKERP